MSNGKQAKSASAPEPEYVSSASAPEPEPEYVSFAHQPRTDGKSISTTNKNPPCPPPPGICLGLYPFQAIDVQAVLDIIRRGGVDVDGQFVRTTCVLLNESPGSGKTIMLAAIIALYHSLRLYPEYRPEIARGSSIKPKRVLLPALVVVANSVSVQFFREILYNTTLRVLVLDRDFEARLATMIEPNEVGVCLLDGYDLVLVRNGTTHKTHTLAAIRGIVGEAVFSLLVFDDADKLDLPAKADLRGTTSSWYVPEALMTIHATGSLPDPSSKSLASIKSSPVSVICNLFFLNFAVSSTSELRDDGIIRPFFLRPADILNPQRDLITLAGALMGSTELVRMLQANALPEAAKLSNAPRGPTTTLAIFTNLFLTKFELFERATVEELYLTGVLASMEMPDESDHILKRHFAQRLQRAQGVPKEAPPAFVPGVVLREWQEHDLMGSRAFTETMPTKALHEHVRKLQARLTLVRRQLSQVSEGINKVKENMGNACCICKQSATDLADENAENDEDDIFASALKKTRWAAQPFARSKPEPRMVIVVKCCGKIICEWCIGSLMPRTTQTDYVAVNGVCPNCRRVICISGPPEKRDVLPISREASHGLRDAASQLENVMQAKLHDATPAPPPTLSASSASSATPTFGSKAEALTFILTTPITDPKFWQLFFQFAPPVNNLLGSDECTRAMLGDLPLHDSKFIIFANYEGTLSEVEKCVVDSGLPYAKIGGESQHIQKTCERFWLPNGQPQAVQVLVLNSIMYCAGLNLQCATHMIAYHRIHDPSIETQVYGRAQRMGRTRPLMVACLFHEGE